MQNECECMNILVYAFCGYQARIPQRLVLDSFVTMKTIFLLQKNFRFRFSAKRASMRTSCFWKKIHFKLALDYNDLGNVPRLVNQMHYCKPTKIPFILSKSKQIKVFKSFVVSTILMFLSYQK
jgi:hypothetical protein